MPYLCDLARNKIRVITQHLDPFRVSKFTETSEEGLQDSSLSYRIK